jgi:hypothetical protein
VFIDPFGDIGSASSRGMAWNYPPITGAAAALLLVTHEHRDDHAVDLVADIKQTLHSSAGNCAYTHRMCRRIASEHDAAARTQSKSSKNRPCQPSLIVTRQFMPRYAECNTNGAAAAG